MFRALLGSIFSQSARVDTDHHWSISGRYSAFSGIVTEISVGTPPQKLQVALNFDSRDIMLYRPESCRAFVGSCFDSSHSSTFTGVSDWLRLANGFSLGQPRIEQVSMRRPSLRFSEVVGWIGATPRAPIFQSKAILIEELPSHALRISELPSDAQPDIVLPVDPFWSGWVATGRWRLEGTLLPGIELVKYDPGEPDLKIPEAVRSDFMKLLKGETMVRDDRLFMACSYRIHIALISHRLAPALPLHPEHLRDPSTILTTGGLFNRRRFCRTRVRFDSTLEGTIIIGRILTRATNGVTLNFIDQWIGLSPRTDWRGFSSSYPYPAALVPVVQYPRLLEGKVILSPVDSPVEYASGLILVSQEERLISIGDFVGRGFLLVRAEDHTAPFLKNPLRTFTDIGSPMVLAKRGIGFSLSESSEFDLFVVYGRRHVALLRVPRPAVTVVHPFASQSENEGGCLLHQKCLNDWVESVNNPTCPMCQDEIPRIVV